MTVLPMASPRTVFKRARIFIEHRAIYAHLYHATQ